MARFSGGGGGRALLKLKMCVLDLSTTLSKILLSLRRIQLDTVVNIHKSPFKVPVVLVRFWSNSNFLDRFFGKYSNMKFYENPFGGSPVVPCG
jgi:hypothetical protein